ncbi:MAG: rod shape-determining protein MreD, partial [Bacteroidaceae bacterium]|nr:rod shape-determining protein MreD [Bacteroidaceae bacterium]
VGFLQPYLLELFLPRDAAENIKSSVSALGFTRFLTLASRLVVVHCLVFFTIESFGFFNWQEWLLTIGGTTLLTLVLLITIETVRR